MLWKTLQASIVIAIVASNLYWQWTPNQLVPAMLGVGLAGALTVFYGWALDLFGWAKRLTTRKRKSESTTVLDGEILR